MALEILSASIPRDTPAERARWQRQQTLNQTIEMAPRATYTVSGTLYWYANDQLMPRLVYPLQEGSLISVEEIDVPALRPPTVQPIADGVSAEAAKLGATLLRIASEAPTNFTQIRGPGCWGKYQHPLLPLPGWRSPRQADGDMGGAQRLCDSGNRVGRPSVEAGGADYLRCVREEPENAMADARNEGKNIKAVWTSIPRISID